MDGLCGAPNRELDNPLHGWERNAELLRMLHLENGMSFVSIAGLIAEGLNAAVSAAEVEAACKAIGITAAPKPVGQAKRKPAAVGTVVPIQGATADPHEPTGCRWINGDTRAAWAFCRDPQRIGSSYCDHHHQRAYLRGTAAEALRKEMLRAKAAKAARQQLPTAR